MNLLFLWVLFENRELKWFKWKNERLSCSFECGWSALDQIEFIFSILTLNLAPKGPERFQRKCFVQKLYRGSLSIRITYFVAWGELTCLSVGPMRGCSSSRTVDVWIFELNYHVFHTFPSAGCTWDATVAWASKLTSSDEDGGGMNSCVSFSQRPVCPGNLLIE